MILMEHLPSDKEAGILPTEIKKLVDSRREVKKLMAAPNINEDLRHQVCNLDFVSTHSLIRAFYTDTLPRYYSTIFDKWR